MFYVIKCSDLITFWIDKVTTSVQTFFCDSPISVAHQSFGLRIRKPKLEINGFQLI